MNTFSQLINKIALEHELIIEQGPSPKLTQEVEQNIQPNEQPVVPDQIQTNQQDNQPEESALPNQEDINSGNIADSKELLYIRLIYKALTTDLDPSQYTDLIDIKEINSKNAKQILKKLESIINNNTTIN